MREPNPDKVMERISARQFQEWRAFDAAFGSIDGMYEREMMAELHELLQVNNQLTGAAITKKGKKNPAGKFHRAPRPWLPAAVAKQLEEDDEAQGVEQGEIDRFNFEVFGPPEQPPTRTLDDAYIEDGE